MTLAGAGILECFASLRNKFPVVGARFKREFQDAERGRVAHFAVWMRFAEGPMIFSACAYNKFSNAVNGIGFSFRCLRGEAFVVVIVTTDDDVGVGVVEGLPERLEGKIVTMFTAGAEERFMKIGESASDRMRGKIGAKPFFFTRTWITATDFGAFTV